MKLKDNFTERAITALKKPEKRTVYHDTQTPGLGLRIEPTGSKNFFWYRKVGGVNKMQRIGEFPALGLAAARFRAGEFNTQLAGWKSKDCATPNPFKSRHGI